MLARLFRIVGHRRAYPVTTSSTNNRYATATRTKPEIWEEEEPEDEKPKHHDKPPSRDRDDDKRFQQQKPKPQEGLIKYLRWSPLPLLALLSYQQYRRLRDTDSQFAHWEISAYRMLPWRTVSRTWGIINNVNLPEWARVPFLSWYANTFGCNVHEAQQDDLIQYRNLGEFFRRELKPGLRPICPKAPITSPADGTVLYLGKIHDGRVEQVKGVTYSLQGFLGPSSWRSNSKLISDNQEYSTSLMKNPEKNALYTAVVYLAPGDYHRFHSPVNWKINFRRHFAGELLSVNPRMARWISGLFTLNERAVYVGEWDQGFFSMTAVGATNVGSIRVYSDEELTTNTWALRKNTYRDKPMDISLNKGAPFGEFNLGSTIVLIFEAPKDMILDLSSPFKIHMGQSLIIDNPQQ